MTLQRSVNWLIYCLSLRFSSKSISKCFNCDINCVIPLPKRQTTWALNNMKKRIRTAKRSANTFSMGFLFLKVYYNLLFCQWRIAWFLIFTILNLNMPSRLQKKAIFWRSTIWWTSSFFKVWNCSFWYQNKMLLFSSSLTCFCVHNLNKAEINKLGFFVCLKFCNSDLKAQSHIIIHLSMLSFLFADTFKTYMR